MAAAQFEFDPLSLNAVESAIPSVAVVTTTTVKGWVADLDDTTQEYLNGNLTVPDDIDSSGTIEFEVRGFAATAAASRVVAFDFDHAAVAHDEDLDSATYTTEASGDKNVINNQNDLEIHSWTETVTNAGWVAGDEVFFRISRDPTTSGTNLTGNWRMIKLVIRVPLA